MTPQLVAVNFGDMSFYSGATFIPDGDYINYHDVIMHQPVDKTTNMPKGAARLGVMITMYPKNNPTEETKLTQFYSMGTKAHESFAPNPETGKGIVPVPGAKGGGMNDSTNWSMYLNSLYQSGLPQGVFANDITVLDGVWVHIANVDEPESRKSMKSNTAEVAQEERRPGKVAIVTEILEGGAPWDNGGGFSAPIAVATPVAARPVAARPPVARPVAAAARPAVAASPRAAAPAPAGRPVAAPRPVAVQAPPPPAIDAASDFEDLKAWANMAISQVLGKNLMGMPRQSLRTETFKAAKAVAGEDIAGQVISNFFDVEDNFLVVLGELSYTVHGPAVVPAA